MFCSVSLQHVRAETECLILVHPQNPTEKEQILRQTVFLSHVGTYSNERLLKLCLCKPNICWCHLRWRRLALCRGNECIPKHTTHTKCITSQQTHNISIYYILFSFPGRAPVSRFDVTLSPKILFKFNVLTDSRQSINDWLDAPLMIHPKETELHRKMSALNRD